MFQDLIAVRAENQVAISWSIPQKTLDKLIAAGFTTVRICRSETASDPCTDAGETSRLNSRSPG
jgi:hypothetical protein